MDGSRGFARFLLPLLLADLPRLLVTGSIIIISGIIQDIRSIRSSRRQKHPPFD